MAMRGCVKVVLFGLILSAVLVGCKKKTDAQRAAEERAKIREKVESSYELLPYRWLKVAVRSQADVERMAPFRDALAALEETKRLEEGEKGIKEVAQIGAAYLRLAKALLAAKKDLNLHDEDSYPLLWTVWTGKSSSFAWYDNGVEHLALSAWWIAASFTTKHVANRPFAFYELSRAETKESWPLLVQLVALLSRGIAFSNTGYHYAAEEELTRYVDWFEILSPVVRATLRLEGARAEKGQPSFQATADQVFASGLAAGYFVRAWNRMALSRDEQATDDVERGLAALEAIGIDNELTQWGWTFVHLKRGRLKKAGVAMARLAESPYLSEETRAKLRANAQALGQGGDATGFFGVFGKGRAALIIGEALIARAGGVKKILVILIGQENATKLNENLTRLKQTRDGVAKHLSVEGGINAAKELGSKGFDLIKEKMKKSDEEPVSDP